MSYSKTPPSGFSKSLTDPLKNIRPVLQSRKKTETKPADGKQSPGPALKNKKQITPAKKNEKSKIPPSNVNESNIVAYKVQRDMRFRKQESAKTERKTLKEIEKLQENIRRIPSYSEMPQAIEEKGITSTRSNKTPNSRSSIQPGSTFAHSTHRESSTAKSSISQDIGENINDSKTGSIKDRICKRLMEKIGKLPEKNFEIVKEFNIFDDLKLENRQSLKSERIDHDDDDEVSFEDPNKFMPEIPFFQYNYNDYEFVNDFSMNHYDKIKTFNSEPFPNTIEIIHELHLDTKKKKIFTCRTDEYMPIILPITQPYFVNLGKFVVKKLESFNQEDFQVKKKEKIVKILEKSIWKALEKPILPLEYDEKEKEIEILITDIDDYEILVKPIIGFIERKKWLCQKKYKSLLEIGVKRFEIVSKPLIVLEIDEDEEMRSEVALQTSPELNRVFSIDLCSSPIPRQESMENEEKYVNLRLEKMEMDPNLFADSRGSIELVYGNNQKELRKSDCVQRASLHDFLIQEFKTPTKAPLTITKTEEIFIANYESTPEDSSSCVFPNPNRLSFGPAQENDLPDSHQEKPENPEKSENLEKPKDPPSASTTKINERLLAIKIQKVFRRFLSKKEVKDKKSFNARLIRQKDSSLYILFKICKMSHLFKYFQTWKSYQSSSESPEIIEKFLHYTASFIQRNWKGYYVRKYVIPALSQIKILKSKLKSLLCGWKTRKVFMTKRMQNHIKNIKDLQKMIYELKNDPDSTSKVLLQQMIDQIPKMHSKFIKDFNSIYRTGAWVALLNKPIVVKIQDPSKNSTPACTERKAPTPPPKREKLINRDDLPIKPLQIAYEEVVNESDLPEENVQEKPKKVFTNFLKRKTQRISILKENSEKSVNAREETKEKVEIEEETDNINDNLWEIQEETMQDEKKAEGKPKQFLRRKSQAVKPKKVQWKVQKKIDCWVSKEIYTKKQKKQQIGKEKEFLSTEELEILFEQALNNYVDTASYLKKFERVANKSKIPQFKNCSEFLFEFKEDNYYEMLEELESHYLQLCHQGLKF
ncbi:hypothetical protein SteCoe_9981 [Stentor coeruleus]|uniref:Uncharacterized protein n=1 Tax=Stentor coeruleus TaxID=5963 RepID=A0A1R2CGK7_9CILI|nr:hypothetical protein SteCoe_9981 [Stentor coeruleus]